MFVRDECVKMARGQTLSTRDLRWEEVDEGVAVRDSILGIDIGNLEDISISEYG
jgi:hypothetical protein